MSKKVHKLSSKSEFDFLLIGISSHENDYRICWAINQQLEILLTRVESLIIQNRKHSELQEFALFTYSNETAHLDYNLISNRCDNGFLVEEMKNIDFLLQVSGEIDDIFEKTLLENLKITPIITTAFVIDTNNLKSKDRLVF